jgi:hypothetical protein
MVGPANRDGASTRSKPRRWGTILVMAGRKRLQLTLCLYPDHKVAIF